MSAPPRFPLWPWIAILLLAVLPAWAVKGLRPDGSLDRPAISKAYFEGESWTVINALEAYRKSAYRGSREDSVYVLKYLGVVYAADPATRAKADACLGGLLRMEPAIDLADLYLPDSIQRIVAQAAQTAQAAHAGNDAGKSEDAPAASVPGTLGNAQGTPMPPRPAADSVAVSVGQAGNALASGGVLPDTAVPVLGMPAGPPSDTLAAPAEGSPADPAPPAGAPSVPDGGGPGVKRRRAWIWPVALGGAGMAAMAVFLLALDAGAGADGDQPRPVDVTLEWPKEGSP